MSIDNNSVFYLRTKNGKYLVAADQGKYNWPKLGNETERVKLKLIRQQRSNDEKVWKIQSTESSLGEHNILGAFKDSKDCYYWKEGYDDDKQGWEFTPASDGDDEVYIRNVSYQQYLVADTKYEGYITTDKTTKQAWTLERVKELSEEDKKVAQVFPFSVASGDSTANGVILWTRVNDNKSELSYEVSETKDFNSIKIDGVVTPSEFGEDRDYTVHVDVNCQQQLKTGPPQQLKSEPLIIRLIH